MISLPLNKKLLTGIVFLMVFTVAGYPQSEKEHANERYNPEMFEDESRAEWQMVDEIIAAVGIKEGGAIADIGGGSGYFSRPLARAVGKSGIVYCCDFATKLLDFLQIKAKEEGLDNIVTVYAAEDRPMLPPKSIDMAFVCDTNHHIENRVEYYTKLKTVLRPGGKVVIIDWHKRDQKVGPPASHNLAQEVAMQELQDAGYELVKEETFLPYQYFLIYQMK